MSGDNFASSDRESKVRLSTSEVVRSRMFGGRGRGFMPFENSLKNKRGIGKEHQGDGDNALENLSNSEEGYTSSKTGRSNNSDAGIKSPSVMSQSQARLRRSSASSNSRSSYSSDGGSSRGSNASKSTVNGVARYQGSSGETSGSSSGSSAGSSAGSLAGSLAGENMPANREEGNRQGGVKGNSVYNGRNGNESVGQPRRPRQQYIPNPDPENEEELFSRGIASGRNFHRYDNIAVTVTGDNAPPKIEHFEQAGLCRILMDNIRRCSYVKPTPVQKHALPIIRSGRDLMACAQTGSGKTAAFLLPTIQCLLENGYNSVKDGTRATPQLLVVTPTRELAIQIYLDARKLSYASDLMIGLCYGGTAYLHQMSKIQEGCNILIGTPGRLLQFLRLEAITLSKLRHLVIDEADKMLDVGFVNDIESIIRHETIDSQIPPQMLMFSATFPQEIQRLASLYMRNYIFIAAGIVGAACEDVVQNFDLVFKNKKKDTLFNLLKKLTKAKTLIFVEKKRTADILASFLSENGFLSVSMHGDRDQKLREEALQIFRSGRMNILVATAVASRGLDIRGVNYVINYDMPKTVDEYVHRIGRTGRVGNRGLALSFYDPETDYALASGIAQLLIQAHQSVPEFLRNARKKPDSIFRRSQGRQVLNAGKDSASAQSSHIRTGMASRSGERR